MLEAVEQFNQERQSRADEWYDIIDGMLDDGFYQYARGTLEGIRDYILDNNNVTDAQIKAVKNIQEHPGNEY